MVGLPEYELERIKRLIALRDGTNYEHEAATAAAKAAEILANYNLQLSEVEISLSEEDRKAVSQVGTYGGGTPDGIVTDRDWVIILLRAVANGCFCQPLVSQNGVWMVGRKADAEAALLIFRELFTQMIPMADLAARQFNNDYRDLTGSSYWDNPLMGNPKKIKRDWKNSWLKGCSRGIMKAMDQHTEDLKQTSGGTALMISREAEIGAYLANQKLKTKTVRQSNNITIAQRMGYEQGLSLGATAGKPKLEGGQ